MLPFFPAFLLFAMYSLNRSPSTRLLPKAWTVRILPITSSASVPALATFSSDAALYLLITAIITPNDANIIGRIDDKARASRHDRA